MTRTTKENEAKLKKFKKELGEKIFSGAAEAMNIQIKNFFANHPRGIGNTISMMKPFKVSGQRTTDIITHFPQGYPAILELGPSGSKEGYNYPYDTTFGTFVAFAEEPQLKIWAQANLSSFNDGMKGLKIGKGGATFFGSTENQWFTASSNRLKKDPLSRTTILKKLRQIKIK